MTTLDGLVAALSEQGGWVDVTAPSDISVDGYAGKAFQRTAPAVIGGGIGGLTAASDCSTMVYNLRLRPGLRIGQPMPAFRSWESEEDDRFVHPGTGPDQLGSVSLYEPGEIETLWVLDIDGTVVVINTRLFPGHRRRTALNSPPCSTRSASTGDERRAQLLDADHTGSVRLRVG